MTRRLKKLFSAVALVAGIGGSAYAFYWSGDVEGTAILATAPVTRGEVVDTVGASGTVQAVTSVQVGTQVSGTVMALGADFNAIVKRGQVLARLDPSLFQAQIEQARANLIRAEADVERLQVMLQDARTKLARVQELWRRQLVAQTELDAGEVAVRSAEAQIRSAEAQVAQARAALRQSEVNLDHSIITAPIAGIVISRNIDIGQTVAASMQAPTLFVLAGDLAKMQVVANLDESDIGRIAAGQPVTFTVDAYPEDTFRGIVSQVRLQPQTVQNVVTYATLIDAPNPDLTLKPGMTANVTIEVARRDDVIRVPNAALRYRPEGATGGEPQVWRSDDGQLTAVAVEPGLSDGQNTEIIDGSVAPGDRVVTRESVPGQATRPQTGASPFPLMQPGGVRRPGG